MGSIFQDGRCGICGRQSDKNIGSSPSTSFCFPLADSLHQYSMLTFISILNLIRRTSGRSLWTFKPKKSWVKIDQLDVTCFIISLFNAQHVSGVNTSILRSLQLICWVISWVVLLWFDVCWCYVVVWLGLHTDTTPLQPYHNVTPTHIEPEQYNPWNNPTNKLQAPEDGCINIRNMLSIK